jgi:Ran GTPase-activating protein (RanGAP) involved in mRNA processing and transport
MEFTTFNNQINLGCNDIGAEGASALADALVVNTTLTNIELHNNGFEDAEYDDI